MTLVVPDLDDLPQETVDAAFAYAAQLAKEKQPNIDTKRGVIGSLVLMLDAVLGAAERTNADLIQQSQSLLSIEANPVLADDDLVDAVISNYRLSRRQAQQARGEVTIVLNQLIAVTVAASAVFEADGRKYLTETAFAGRTAAENVLADTDRLITQIADDRWAFTVEVVAEEAGSAGMLRKDDKLTPTAPPPSFVSAYAASDFSGGLDQQTNEDLIALMAQGIAARAWSNRDSIPATVRNADVDEFDSVTAEFDEILGMSIVGMGDPEMVRDQHWLLPMSGGGRSDVYLRSQALPQTTALSKTATLIDETAEGGIWQFSIGRDEAPGFYEVTRVALSGADVETSSYEVTEDIRGIDLTGDDVYLPDVDTAEEGAYSRFQAATIRFKDTDTDTSSLTVGSSTQDYDVSVSAMPLVKNVQEYLGDRKVVDPAGDVLVKGAVPCFLSLSMTIERRNTDATVDEDAIKTALAAYVNGLGFVGRLYASALSRVVDELLPANVDVRAIDMFGRVRRPDGENVYVRSSDILAIPDQASKFVSGRTTVFLLETASIGLSVVGVDVPEV